MNKFGFTSIDMIRLKFRVGKFFAEKILHNYGYDPDIEYWIYYGVKGYKHNFKIPMGESSIYLGVERLEDRKSNKVSVVMEFNPNKVFITNDFWVVDCRVHPFFVACVSNLREDYDFRQVEVKYIHYCKDFDYPIESYFIDRGKRDLKIFHCRGATTYYLGRDIKVYEKHKEVGYFEAVTRFEVKIDFGMVWDKCRLKDDIKTGIYLVTEDMLTGNDGAIMYAVMNGYDIQKLTQYTRKKIRKKLEEEGKEIVVYKEEVESEMKRFRQFLENYVFNFRSL